MKKLIAFYALFMAVIAITAYSQESDLTKTARKELDRSMQELKKESKPPYFISYSITDINSTKIVASFGKIESENSNRSRILDIDLRVGDYNFDNTHIIRGNAFNFGSGGGSVELPLENNEQAIRNAIWNATDRSYKKALERYQKAVTNKAVKVKEEDTSADFSHITPSKYFEANAPALEINYELWKDRLRRVSALFANEKDIYVGDVFIQVENNTKYFISSEGTELQWSEPAIRIFISAKTKAEDGMSLPLYKSYFAYTANKLPDEQTLMADAKTIIKTLKELKEAPLMTTYTGPAILSGEAAGVFFHEIFGHRVEGHRQKDPNSSQTFKNYLNEKVLPNFIDVVFDPTIKELNGRDIAGYYKYDDEGVKAEKVVTVENGIFKNFLMSRNPIEKFAHSNGHGRKQAGNKVCSRQSNLIVEAQKTVSVNELKDLLREECKKQNREYGLYFDMVQGGFTFTGRTIPNAFNVQPLVVHKVYADASKPDELVRGVDLIGTPLTTFANILAAGSDLGIFNGVCGAESGGVPVSASSPSLLVSSIEVQKKAKSQAKPPILEAPAIENAGR